MQVSYERLYSSWLLSKEYFENYVYFILVGLDGTIKTAWENYKYFPPITLRDSIKLRTVALFLAVFEEVFWKLATLNGTAVTNRGN